MTNIFLGFAKYLQNFNKKNFDRYLILFLSGILVSTSFITYYVYSQSASLVIDLKKLEELVNKTTHIISENEKLQQKETQLQQRLEQYKEFDIRTSFEKFYIEQKLNPEPDWGGNVVQQPLEGNEKFDEVVLSATFKNLTTQTLVNLLSALDKQEIIYIKALTIKNESNKNITINITLATKKYVA